MTRQTGAQMTRLRYRMRAPGNLTAVFLAVAAVAVSALVWLGIGIVRRDRALEIQRLDERREAAADRLVASLERALAADERLLAGNAKPAGDRFSCGRGRIFGESRRQGPIRPVPLTQEARSSRLSSSDLEDVPSHE